MDLATVLGTYFRPVQTYMVFSGQRDGAIRKMIERVLENSRSPLVADAQSLAECAGMYPVALIEFATPFDADCESGDLASSLISSHERDFGAHAFQMYFLNHAGQVSLMQALTMLNRRRQATPALIGDGHQIQVSNCFAGEYLYELIIARQPLPKVIAAA